MSHPYQASRVANGWDANKGYTMRVHPTALGWIDLEVSTAFEWHRAQIRRLAKSLGYELIWLDDSLLPVTEQARAVDVDAVIVPSPCHLHPLTLNALLTVTDVETVLPRITFERWAMTHTSGRCV